MIQSGCVIGVDASSKKLALFAVIDGRYVAAAVHLGTPWSPQHAEKAYRATSHYLHELLGGRYRGGRAAFVEAAVVAGSRNLQSTIKQAYVSGGVQTAFAEWGFGLYLPAISTWKKGCGAGGNASKAKVEETIRRRWPSAHRLCAGDQDLLDACGVAHHGCAVVSLGSTLGGQGSL